MSSADADLAVVGAGAAGLATAIFAARRATGSRVIVLDGAARLGAKILISGGGRCNVTNRVVRGTDYWGGSRRAIETVLKAFPADKAARFFEDLGVPLHEEERGKLFPDSNRARTVLDALLAECARLRVEIRCAQAVTAVTPASAVGSTAAPAAGWRVSCAGSELAARRVVLATGGLSVPKTGSDGRGLQFASSLGHTIVPLTPALVPLLLAGPFHSPLSGVSHEAAIAIESDGKVVARLRGPLLWTHFGISGPVALDASRHWLRAGLAGGRVAARLSFVPGLDFAAVEKSLTMTPGKPAARPLRAVLGDWMPTAVGESLLAALDLDPALRLPHLSREDRRRLAHALTGWELPITGSRGYNYAEATAGGVSLDEVDCRTMGSTKHPGLHLVGEMLDVDGRLGGFNFQWAWSSAWVAGEAIGRALALA